MRSRSMFPNEGGTSSKSAPAASRGSGFLGRYRIVEEIGIGGMASVHLARMDGPGGFQKWAAIKKIHSHLVDDESVVQMFLDEARVAARISHPNVATVFDLDKHDATYWIAMEYLHGESLREVMRWTEESGTAIPPEISCRIIADAAEGLHAAHELRGTNGASLNLVHRDASPHNIFVTYEGATKVVDFGIAKFNTRANHTGAGVLKGKLAYMSPEQAHGEHVDRRTDVFALGVVLWELTTGQRLFWMESDFDTFLKVEDCAVPRPSTLVRDYPYDLEQIVMKALAKNRAERFSSARDLSRALQSLLMHRDIFISSEEVAAYMRETFAERIRKRDAHLRWAAEVTQTDVERRTLRPALDRRPSSPEISDTILAEVLPTRPAGPVTPHQGAMPFSNVGNAEFHPTPAPIPAGRPAWVIAAVASSLALLIAGVALVLVTVTRPHAKDILSVAELESAVSRSESIASSAGSPALAAPEPVASAGAPNEALGKLRVICLGAKCDQITDNGTPVNPEDTQDRPVTPGMHELVLSAENGVKKTVFVVIVSKQTSELRISME